MTSADASTGDPRSNPSPVRAAELAIPGVSQHEIDILLRYVADSQTLRTQLAEASASPDAGVRAAGVDRLTREIGLLDREALPAARKLVLGGFWETGRRRDIDLDLAVYLVVQHVFDRDLVARMLPQLRRLVRARKMSADFYAAMFDRRAVLEGRKQRYGTQFFCKDGELALQPLERPEAVERLRRTLGLTLTLEQYAAPMIGRRC